MTREEARLILQSCRLGGQDAADPQFAEALALAKRDPELAAWFEQERKFDTLVGGSLRQVRAPARLKAEILALGKSVESPAESPISVWWRNLFSWNSPVSWAMASAIVVLLGLVIFWKKPESPGRFADFSAQMVQAAVNDPHHVDAGASDLKQAVAWLGAHHERKQPGSARGLERQRRLDGLPRFELAWPECFDAVLSAARLGARGFVCDPGRNVSRRPAAGQAAICQQQRLSHRQLESRWQRLFTGWSW
jgi:hypothetical protein